MLTLKRNYKQALTECDAFLTARPSSDMLLEILTVYKGFKSSFNTKITNTNTEKWL